MDAWREAEYERTDAEYERLMNWFRNDLEKARHIEMRSTLEDMDNALGWVVITSEPEIQRVRVFGLFDEPAAALECASAAERVRSEDMGEDEDDWSVQVYPLLPP